MTAQRDDERERRIVVGVDGSARSKAALAWAVRQAGLTGPQRQGGVPVTGPAHMAQRAWDLSGVYGCGRSLVLVLLRQVLSVGSTGM